MSDTNKKLDKLEFAAHRKAFDTTKYKVDEDIFNLLTSDGDKGKLAKYLEDKEADDVAKEKRVPQRIADAYITWADSEQSSEDNQTLVDALKEVCSAPALLAFSTKLWCDVQQNKKWCDFNEAQSDGYPTDEEDDFTDIGTGSLLNEDTFLDTIAGIQYDDEE